jgi:hypothetical protein
MWTDRGINVVRATASYLRIRAPDDDVTGADSTKGQTDGRAARADCRFDRRAEAAARGGIPANAVTALDRLTLLISRNATTRLAGGRVPPVWCNGEAGPQTVARNARSPWRSPRPGPNTRSQAPASARA